LNVKFGPEDCLGYPPVGVNVSFCFIRAGAWVIWVDG
jgi:hypothetical protein